MPPYDRFVDVLLGARDLLARPGNDFTWSWWEGASDALAEIDRLIAAAPSDPGAVNAAAILFLPTGPMQEVAVSSGWGDEFLDLASQYDLLPDGPPADTFTRFYCVRCRAECGVVELIRSIDGIGEVRRTSFTGVLTQRGTANQKPEEAVTIDVGHRYQGEIFVTSATSFATFYDNRQVQTSIPDGGGFV